MNTRTEHLSPTRSIEDVMSSLRQPRAARLVIAMLEALEGGSVAIHLPDGAHLLCGEGPRVATMRVQQWSVFERILTKGSIGFAEAFMGGDWRAEGEHGEMRALADLLSLLAANRAQLARAIHGNALRLIFYRLGHMLRANTRRGSKRNIEAHYDLGNDFYALWLDETMSYSSALFAQPDMSLADAQREKYRHLLREIGARPGQTILEVGCGWGGFAEIACLEFGCQVHGITLSPSQLAWAQQRAERGGFADHVQLELRDYRDMQGRFDHVVSIEMIEAVGEQYWPSYFTMLARSLKPGGRIAIQGISIANELFAHYRRDVDFIQRYVFPGGMLFSPAVFEREAKAAGLVIRDQTRFGLDYARTLALWAERFDARLDEVRAQGFDERFIHLWHFYLAYCEAGFRTGNTDVHHYVLEATGASSCDGPAH